MKLTYFATRGRVEPARLMLELTGTPYEFRGVSVEEWRNPEVKARLTERTPFSQVPTLEDGSFFLCQSGAINRYLARKLRLWGDTIEEQAGIDEVYETAGDVISDASMLHWNPKFSELRPKHRETMGKKLEGLDKFFSRVGASPEFWVFGDRYTVGDVVMAFALETVLPLHPGLVESFPKLYHAMKTFYSADGVRQYVRSDRRPRTWTVPIAFFAGKPEETHHWTD
jgi:glutathione S-transferase